MTISPQGKPRVKYIPKEVVQHFQGRQHDYVRNRVIDQIQRFDQTQYAALFGGLVGTNYLYNRGVSSLLDHAKAGFKTAVSTDLKLRAGTKTAVYTKTQQARYKYIIVVRPTKNAIGRLNFQRRSLKF